MSCATCNGRGKVQDGIAGDELSDCPDCAPCGFCEGSGIIPSGGMTPWGSAIDLPCPECRFEANQRLLGIGAAWEFDSRLEQWFPITADELKKLQELNNDKFRIIEAYCKAASRDKWKIATLLKAVDEFLSAEGYKGNHGILTRARADVVNDKP